MILKYEDDDDEEDLVQFDSSDDLSEIDEDKEGF